MQEKISTYFAAANSYRGFISYFDKIFPSTEFEKIFVLKGGPGTGKTTVANIIAKESNMQLFKLNATTAQNSFKYGCVFPLIQGLRPSKKQVVK